MTKRMLIDATHDEETRVAVIDEKNTLTDFDYESQFRKALKGSIFLAKVTRVEPSLQAAFVNYGGNRHGFLPFSEIHPDYFRIPIADREALLAEQEAAMAEAEAAEEAEDAEAAEALKNDEKKSKKPRGGKSKKDDDAKVDDAEAENSDSEETADVDAKNDKPSKEADADNSADEKEDASGNSKEDPSEEDDVDGNKAGAEVEEGDDNKGGGQNKRRRNSRGRRGGGNRGHRSRGAQKQEDNPERRFRYNLRRKYKIQEVIKRGQIMLIQVSKEERGNKGAAVGSYLSLPGRYCVLMPNSPRAGGVSRKIANYKDRARMREIMKDLQVPKGMSVILRTAGVERTKTEIKRDLDYLLKLWNNIRELTLQSSAPALVYEEADLIKRAVRDLYTRDVEEIIVSGDDGYKNAKNFMKMMIPSHAKRVKEYKNVELPLFNKYKIERQIAEIGEVSVTLPSGGYLVINPTEALVSIDVNSGKSTKERHIEETALRTNLEAAEEVARQLRLRDLGGLVVIDFIDMEDRRNNGKVERKMRDALSGDRARVQNGRISSFGLMELSRQRLNPSLTESQFEICTNCAGTGSIRTADASSIMVLRAIEDEGIKARAAQLIVHVSNAVAVYILNNKRNNLATLEKRYNFEILIRVDETVGASSFRVEVSKPLNKSGKADDDSGESNNSHSHDKNDDERPTRSRRRGRRGGRRRGNRGGDNDQQNSENQNASDNQGSEQEAAQVKDNSDSDKAVSEKPKRTTRKPKEDKVETEAKADTKPAKDDSKADEKSADKKPAARGRKPKAADDKPKKADEKKETAAKDKKPAASKAKAVEKKAKPPSNDDKPKKKPEPKEYETVNKAPEKKKKGWWNRLGGE